VTLTENQTTGEVGGVWVNGGELVLNDGAAIKKMSVTAIASYSTVFSKGGGVLISNRGKLTMNGGLIGGEDASEGTTVSVTQYSGGGVLVLDGSFDMYGGTIQFNTVQKPYGGAAVYNNATFNMYGGIIRENTANSVSSSGGIFNKGTFTIYDGIIQENTAQAESSGGGVFNAGESNSHARFTMNGGTIQKNTAQGSYSGGGVLASSDGTFTMNAGTIKGNSAAGEASYPSGGGVHTLTEFIMNGGTIGDENPNDSVDDANTTAFGANGVFVGSGDFTMAGGKIMGNTKAGTNNYGVYINSSPYHDNNLVRFVISGPAQVAAANRVFLKKGKNLRPTITIDEPLSAQPVANIIIDNPSAGEKILRASSPAVIGNNLSRFTYDDQNNHITSSVSGPDSDGYYYGVYQ
jgi:hypothetical protein